MAEGSASRVPGAIIYLRGHVPTKERNGSGPLPSTGYVGTAYLVAVASLRGGGVTPGGRVAHRPDRLPPPPPAGALFSLVEGTRRPAVASPRAREARREKERRPLGEVTAVLGRERGNTDLPPPRERGERTATG